MIQKISVSLSDLRYLIFFKGNNTASFFRFGDGRPSSNFSVPSILKHCSFIIAKSVQSGVANCSFLTLLP